jgi:hypothetical protein
MPLLAPGTTRGPARLRLPPIDANEVPSIGRTNYRRQRSIIGSLPSFPHRWISARMSHNLDDSMHTRRTKSLIINDLQFRLGASLPVVQKSVARLDAPNTRRVLPGTKLLCPLQMTTSVAEWWRLLRCRPESRHAGVRPAPRADRWEIRRSPPVGACLSTRRAGPCSALPGFYGQLCRRQRAAAPNL